MSHELEDNKERRRHILAKMRQHPNGLPYQKLVAMVMEEFGYNLKLSQMRDAELSRRESAKEEAKSKRISQQNTEQSKLIDQRKNNLPPMNFESNEDSLDGFDLAEFSPR